MCLVYTSARHVYTHVSCVSPHSTYTSVYLLEKSTTTYKHLTYLFTYSTESSSETSHPSKGRFTVGGVGDNGNTTTKTLSRH